MKQKSKINLVKKELGLTQNDIAKMFGYKDGGSYARSARKKHVDNGIVEIHERTKKVASEKPTLKSETKKLEDR